MEEVFEKAYFKMVDPNSCSFTRASLLLRIRDADDDHAWKVFVTIYYPLIHRWAVKRGLQPTLAEEVAQQVLYQVAQSIGAFEYDKDRGSFRGWLFTITRREVVRLLQSENRVGERVGGSQRDAILEGLESEYQATEWTARFNQHICDVALARIQGDFDPETWQAFDLVWKQGRASAEVAKELGRSPAWVYKAKFKVSQRLKEELLYLAEDIAFLQ